MTRADGGWRHRTPSPAAEGISQPLFALTDRGICPGPGLCIGQASWYWLAGK